MRFYGKKRIAMAVLLGVGIMAGTMAVSQTGYAAELLTLKVSSVSIDGVEDYKVDLIRRLMTVGMLKDLLLKGF